MRMIRAGLAALFAFAASAVQSQVPAAPGPLATVLDSLRLDPNGTTLTADDVTGLGKKILSMERDFNARAGFSKEQDRLPEFFKSQPVAPHQVTFKVSDEELDQVFNW